MTHACDHAPDHAPDHGGALDAAIAQFGGARSEWVDLSTGINPHRYPLPDFTPSDWSDLPDHGAMDALLDAARAFWRVPETAEIIAAPGASSLISRLPYLRQPTDIQIARATYNEHRAAFESAAWHVVQTPAQSRVVVHPNNPDGRIWRDPAAPKTGNLLVIDESFCDTCPEQTLIRMTSEPGVVLLKSFGKFWGLAGARLGFAVGAPETLSRLSDLLGPWPVSGPVLRLGAQALADFRWAEAMRKRLSTEAAQLDVLMAKYSANLVGGTSLFRLFSVANAQQFHRHLTQNRILCRIFPYSKTWVRFGLPTCKEDWQHLEKNLENLS
ncbi:MAG: pyridoxal phosphate-dependent class II aminotransferase [Alphaproteobacteria bacterium]|nr:pyridoxal phosphate-dependent class II aminotransferase [Alphaproteobacteria bacterium]